MQFLFQELISDSTSLIRCDFSIKTIEITVNHSKKKAQPYRLGQSFDYHCSLVEDIEDVRKRKYDLRTLRNRVGILLTSFLFKTFIAFEPLSIHQSHPTQGQPSLKPESNRLVDPISFERHESLPNHWSLH